MGGEALVLPTDVADAAQVEAAADAVEQAFGPIDIWVNNAMVSVFSPIKDMTAEEFQRVTAVTYLGYVYGTLAALRRMLPRDQGLIIQVGSALAYRGIPLQAAYCAAKHAVQGFTEALRCELLHDQSNVRVTMVQMPALNTPQFAGSEPSATQTAACRPSFSPKWRRTPLSGRPSRTGARCMWAGQRSQPLWAISSPLAMPTAISPTWGMTPSSMTGLADPDRPHNLWEPLPGDHGAHGDFDARATRTSLQFWINKHRRALALAGLGLAGALYALCRSNGRR